MIDSKRITKNTIFLYFRLILVLVVTLYTSRVILAELGVTDYGLYNAVYSIIGLLSFLNGTLSSGTSRFITFSLGKNNQALLQSTFSTTLIAHVFLAVFIIFVGETIGLWYFYNVAVIPPERLNACFIVYQISILSTAITIIQVPYTAEIMAHERMGVYAYIGIYEAVTKLLIVFLLSKTDIDKLCFYAILIFIIHLSIFVFYYLYCTRQFKEVSITFKFDKKIFKAVLHFSGWNIIANFSNTLMKQGVITLFNLFFSPVVVAAQAVCNHVSNALMQFVNNVRQAVNPQVIKLYANEQYDESKKLTYRSAELIYYLLLLLGVPLIMTMPTLLNLWLVDVPDYTVAFARLIIIQDILGNFSAAFYTPMIAANKLKKNAYASMILCTFQFLLLYILFKWGFGPLWARYLAIFTAVIFSFVIKPYILWKDIDYNIRDIYKCLFKCVKVSLLVIFFCSIIYLLLPQDTVFNAILVAFLSVLIILVIVLIFMDKRIRKRLVEVIIRKIK